MLKPPDEPGNHAADDAEDPYQVSEADSGFPEQASERVKPKKRREQSTVAVVATVVIAIVVGVIVFGVTFVVTCIGVLAAGNTGSGSGGDALFLVALVLPFLTGIVAAGLAGFLVMGIASLFRR